MKLKKGVKYFFIYLLVFTCIFMIGRGALSKIGNIRIFSGEEELSIENDNKFFEEKFGKSERVNFLLIGINEKLADTIILGSYDLKNQFLDLISIPRDTYYDVSGNYNERSKINSIYARKTGGIQGTVTAVSKLLGDIPIHYYAVIDYKGVANITEAIGGVRVTIPFHMKYDDPTATPPLYIDIEEGEQLITRDNVIELLRFRKTNSSYARQGYKGYPMGDLDRIKMQQQFLEAAIKQSIGPKLPQIVKTSFENIDSNLDVKMAIKLATKAILLPKENIITHTLAGDALNKNKLSFYWVDSEKAIVMLQEIYQRKEELKEGALNKTNYFFTG